MIIDVPWEDVHVKVPDILIARRFVVLPGRRAVATVRFPNPDRDLLDKVMNGVSIVSRKVVQIFVVPRRDH